MSWLSRSILHPCLFVRWSLECTLSMTSKMPLCMTSLTSSERGSSQWDIHGKGAEWIHKWHGGGGAGGGGAGGGGAGGGGGGGAAAGGGGGGAHLKRLEDVSKTSQRPLKDVSKTSQRRFENHKFLIQHSS